MRRTEYLWGALLRSNMTGETRLDDGGNTIMRSEAAMAAMAEAFAVIEAQDLRVGGTTFVKKRDGRVKVTVTAEDCEYNRSRFVRSVRIEFPKGSCPGGGSCASVSSARFHPSTVTLRRTALEPADHWIHVDGCPALTLEVVLED